MSKSGDLLGLIIDTSLVPADDDPGFDGKGYTALITPADNDPADEDEDDAAFKGLLDSGLSQEEAQEAVDYMKPLSDDERAILEETPLLDGLTRVDDAEHDRWLGQKASEGHDAIDRALEDAIYGDNTMAHDEEGMERNDTDSGWGFRSAFRKVGRGIKKAGRGVGRGISKGIKTPFGAMARFIPGRDARKARLLKNVYRKLWYEHANWLANQDKAAGLPLKPRANYEYVSKLWAREEMRKNKLPTNFAMAGADILGAQILGAEAMGAWYWPFGNFLNFSRTTIRDTADKRDGSPPDEQSDAEKPEFEPVGEPSPGEGGPQPPTDDSQQGEIAMEGWNHIRKLKGDHDILGAEDSLGAFASQILGSDQPAKDNPHAERIVKTIAVKLKTGQPISPSELGLLSSAAREGNARAQRVLVVLESRGVAMSGDESGLDPWMYKLNPAYWIASKRKKDLIDIEKKNWVENARLQKQLAKQKEVLDEAERAAQAAQAVAAAKQQSAATEAQLKEIEASLKGSMSGTFVGHEKIMPISAVVVRALEKAGKKDRAGKLYGKIKAGQPLDAGELKEARQIANLIGRMKVVHGDLVSESEETLAMHGAFIGACVMGSIGAAQDQNSRHGQFAESMGMKIASGQPISAAERHGLARVLGDQSKLHRFTASLVSGAAFVGCPQGKTWTRGAFVGAVKAMSEQDRKALSSIVKLAKIGNPRAQRALSYLKKSGEIMGGECLGESRLQKAFNYAAAPIKLAGDESGWSLKPWKWGKKKKQSANDIRLAKMRAAAQRAKAARAKAAAADAETEAEQRAQQAIADAADAEADAADAEAMAKEQQMKTAESEANPDTIPTSAGDFIGGWTDMIGKDTKARKIVQRASEQSAAGTKIRAGAELYKRARKGDPKAKRALKIMSIKAKKGDPQARRDLNAVKAGRIAVRAKARAERKQIVMQKRAARKARVVAAQRGFESRAAERLARMSRKHELKKLAKVERKASKGDPKARAFVAKRVAAAKRGDKKAVAQVRGMKLARCGRMQVRTPRERRNMRAAERMVRRIRRNDPKAIRQLRILQAAASKGNPNAIRTLQRLALAGAFAATIATGVVTLPKVATSQKGKKAKRLVPGTPAHAKAQRLVAAAKAKAATGTGTREELTAGARVAHQIGDKASTGQLARAASKAPSATEAMKSQANEVAAAQSGNPAAQESLDKTLADAKAGNVKAIDKLGTIQAVKTIDDINKGKPISPTMADALNTHAQAQAGDLASQEMLQRISEDATKPNPAPEAVLAATGAVAASKLSAALANRPQARQQLMEKANSPIPAAEKGPAQAEVAEILAKANEGTVTPEEGQRGVELAQRLGKPKLAAEIRAKAPPYEAPPSTSMSSLPDAPLPPIQGARQLIKESLRAVTLTTRDPLANYREGVAARSKDAPAAAAAMTVTSSGWSPFKAYKAAKRVAPFTPFAAPFAAASALADSSRKRGAPAPEPAPAPSPAPAPAAETPAATATAGEFVGSADSFKDLIANALQSRKMSKSDFNKAVDATVGPNAPAFAKKASAEQTLKFLQSKQVTVGGASDSLGRIGPSDAVWARRAALNDQMRIKRALQHLSGENFVGASDAELEKLMSKSLTDDQLDRLMTKAMQDDAMLDIIRILQKRPDLGKRVAQQASAGHPAAGKIHGLAKLAANARSGDPAAKKTFMDWCSTQSHASSSGHDSRRRPAYVAYMKSQKQGRKWGQQGDDILGDFVGTFVGKSDDFKQLIIAALKTKKMSRDDFNKAVAAHVKPDANPAEKTAAGEKMLHFLASKNVKVG